DDVDRVGLRPPERGADPVRDASRIGGGRQRDGRRLEVGGVSLRSAAPRLADALSLRRGDGASLSPRHRPLRRIRGARARRPAPRLTPPPTTPAGPPPPPRGHKWPPRALGPRGGVWGPRALVWGWGRCPRGGPRAAGAAPVSRGRRGTRLCRITGPVSAPSSTKWTVHPDSSSPA